MRHALMTITCLFGIPQLRYETPDPAMQTVARSVWPAPNRGVSSRNSDVFFRQDPAVADHQAPARDGNAGRQTHDGGAKN